MRLFYGERYLTMSVVHGLGFYLANLTFLVLVGFCFFFCWCVSAATCHLLL